MELGAWLRLLWRSRFAVDADMRGAALQCTLHSAVNTWLGLWQRLLYGGAIARTQLVDDPLFVLGHWRSGTTFLFDLLASDERFTFPTYMTCTYPQHVVLTRRLIERYVRFEEGAKRGIDNVPIGLRAPREDEFALLALGLPSPYTEVAFPNLPPPDPAALPLEIPDLDRWKAGFLGFLKLLTYLDRRRLLLKSPTHTARLAVLGPMFPRARFLNIVRHPRDVIPSTLKLLRAMYLGVGLQKPDFHDLEERAFRNWSLLDRKLQEGRGSVRLHELRYEDLVADPLGELRKAYAALELGELPETAVEAYLRRLGQHTHTGNPPVDERLEARIREVCGPFMARYGYS